MKDPSSGLQCHVLVALLSELASSRSTLLVQNCNKSNNPQYIGNSSTELAWCETTYQCGTRGYI